MGNLFNMDNAFWRFASKLTSVVWLNILWVICCIPIVTIGPSTAAMYYVLLKLVRDEEGYIARSFFHSFKENFKQGVIMTVILLFIAGLGAADFYFYLHNTQGVYLIFKFIFMAATLFYFIEVVYIFPVLGKFSNTTTSLMKNALLIGIRHLPQTVLIILIHIAVIVLIMLFPPIIIFGMPLAAFFSSYLFVRIFDNYIPKDEEKNRFTEEEWEEIQRAEEPVEHIVYSMDDMDDGMSTSQLLKMRAQEEKKRSDVESKADEEPNLTEDEKMLL